MKRLVIISIFCFLMTALFSQNSQTETQVKDSLTLILSKLDPIEGIWNISIKTSLYNKGRKLSDFTTSVDKRQLGKDSINEEGYWNKAIDGYKYKNEDLFACQYYFVSTAEDNSYLFKNPFEDITKNVTLSEGKINFSYQLSTTTVKDILATIGANYDLGDEIYREFSMTKLFPTATTTSTAIKASKGTGFAISSSGYIATCNHVIAGATSIKVRGIGGDFNKSFTAKVISTDANNDLAILKIDDIKITTLGVIPYTISSTTKDVGTSIFTLGYPLTATMGEEIKLTDGLISAKSGYIGDITSYQISAAAQSGNSGGPLFDKSGNLIGVVNAKHVFAENATYAVKSTYLKILIEALPTAITTPTVKSLTAKVLTEQVKSIKNFVYIIEVN